MEQYICKICKESFKNNSLLARHILKIHNIKSKEYFDAYLKKETDCKCLVCGQPTTYIDINVGYKKFCSRSCANKYRVSHSEYKELPCKICNKIISTEKRSNELALLFISHIKNEHNINDVKIYYDKYIKQENEEICPICGNLNTFKGLLLGYSKYCTKQCFVKDNMENNTNNMYKITHDLADYQKQVELEKQNIQDRVKKYNINSDKARHALYEREINNSTMPVIYENGTNQFYNYNKCNDYNNIVEEMPIIEWC